MIMIIMIVIIIMLTMMPNVVPPKVRATKGDYPMDGGTNSYVACCSY